MKIVTIVGARPQFIKCAPLSRELRKEHAEILVHTGQHYDPEMSDIFFQELNIPKPDYYLGVGSGPHGKQTGEILARVEDVLIKERPETIIVFGDTNSTLAGALAAVKLHIPVTHVEAGLRSFDRSMPEEINRVLTDHISDLLFCPTTTAVRNLEQEGLKRGVFLTGDIMVDALLYNRKIAVMNSDIIQKLRAKVGQYLVITVHRPSNTDNPDALRAILSALEKSGKRVIFPIHPRTKKFFSLFGLLEKIPVNVTLIEPLGYLDMLCLMAYANKILTDSGGIQKEAYILGIPCITLRNTTEWVETVEDGWNILVDTDENKIIQAIEQSKPERISNLMRFGNGHAAIRMAELLSEKLPQ